MIWGERSISVLDVLREAAGRAQHLKVQAGDRVMIFSENRLEWVYSLYAAWQNKAIVVPVDHLSTSEELAYMVEDCQPAVLTCSTERRPVVLEALKKSKHQPVLLPIEESAPAAQAPAAGGFPKPPPEQTALIMYTSGTTGSPKGVMLSFDNLYANIQAVSHDVPIFTAEDRVLALLPLHHILPLMGCVVIPLFTGATTVFATSLASEDIIGALQRNRVTIIIGVPRFYAMIRKGIRDKINKSPVARTLFSLAGRVQSRAFSKRLFGAVHRKFGGCLKVLVSGGAALDPEVERDLITLGFEVLQGFGMTEAAPMITFPRPGHTKFGSCGQALPGQSVKIVEGEVVASGRNIMKGYYHKPAETAEAVREGWLYTGDLGHLDADGHLFITGRKKELLVLPNGKKINPLEVESRLLGMSPALKEAGVLFKDGVLQALLVPDQEKLAADGVAHVEDWARWEIVDAYNQGASPSKRIMRVHILNQELPKTRLGKLKRFQLEALAGAPEEQKKEEEAPDTPEYGAIRDFLQNELERAIGADDHFVMDLGLDSLTRVSLQVFLQKTFGVEVNEKLLAACHTARRLAVYIAEHKTRLEVEAVNWTEILQAPVEVKLPSTWKTLVLINTLARWGLRLCFRLRGSGLENIPPAPFILAANHQSYVDGVLVTAFLPAKVLEQTFFYAKKKHVRNAWMQFMADTNNIIVVDSDHDLKSSLLALAAVLRRGQSLIIFPEGTRTRDGALGDYKKTFAILSRELKVPVVPVVIQGAFEALPRGSRLPKFNTPVSVRFLPPIVPAGLSVDQIRDQTRDAAGKSLERK